MEEKKETKLNVIPRDFNKNVLVPFIDYLESNNYSVATQKQYSDYIYRLIKSDERVTDMSSEKIKNFLNKRTSLLYQASIKKFIQFLSDELNIDITPFQYPRIKNEEKVIVPLTRDEIQLLIDNMPDDDSGLFFRFKLLTELLSKGGLRVSEGVSLKIGDINFAEWDKDRSKDGSILLTHTKNNRERLIPISSDMMKKLSIHSDSGDGFRRDDNCYIFDYDYSGYIKRCNNKKKKAIRDGRTFIDEKYWNFYYIKKSIRYYEIILAEVSKKVLKKHITPHLLRFSYATYLNSKNIQTPIIQKLLGHKSLSTTGRYINPSESEMAVGIIK